MTKKGRDARPSHTETQAAPVMGSAPVVSQPAPDPLEAQDSAAVLDHHQEVTREIEQLKASRDEAREQASQLGKDAQKILASLSPEDRASIEAWVGLRDKLQQAQGALNVLGRFAGRLHNLEAMLGRERRRRTEMTRIKGELEKLLGRRQRGGRQGKDGPRAPRDARPAQDFKDREFQPRLR